MNSNWQGFHSNPKRPKLEIDKKVGLPASASSSMKCSSHFGNINKGANDDLWRDDELDSDILEQAISQVEITKPKNSPRVLRRIASSGWPSTNTFSPSSSNHGWKERTTNANDLSYTQILEQNKRLKESFAKSSGEASILREKNNHMEKEKAQLQKTLMEKMEAIKKDAEIERIRLLKENKSLKSQLEIQDMEKQAEENRVKNVPSVSRLNSDPPNRRFQGNSKTGFLSSTDHHQTIFEECLRHVKSIVRTKTQYHSFELFRKLVFPQLTEPTQPEPTISEPVRTACNPGLFSGLFGSNRQINGTTSETSSKSVYFTAVSNVKTTIPKEKIPPKSPCPKVESCIVPLLSVQTLDFTSDKGQEIMSQVLRTCHEILLHQLYQLSCVANPRNLAPEKDREVIHCKLNNLRLGENYNLLSGKELYNNERGIGARRALKLLSILVDVTDLAAEQILLRPISNQPCEKNGNPTDSCSTALSTSASSSSQVVLRVVQDIIHEIYLKRKTALFEGVLAGATSLVRNLLMSSVNLSQESQDMVVQVLRCVVMAQPGSLVIHQVVQLLLAATKYTNIMDKLCHNSEKETFLENPRKSAYLFTAGSCVLQVLCKQIELVESPKKYLLSDVFTLWVLSLFYGNPKTPWWLFSVPSKSLCLCRPLISRLSFTLLGEACLIYPKISPTNSVQTLYTKLLSQGILVVSTLLYQDEHFGTNVDTDSVGYYELFVHSMTNMFDIELNKPCRDILEKLYVLESSRQPMYTCEGNADEVNDLLKFLCCSDNDNEVLECLNLHIQ